MLKNTQLLIFITLSFILNSGVTQASSKNESTICCDEEVMPINIGIGGQYSYFGSSISADSGASLISAPGILNHGVVYYAKPNDQSNEWQIKETIFPPEPSLRYRFGSHVLLNNDLALIYSESSYYQSLKKGFLDIFKKENEQWKFIESIEDDSPRQLTRLFAVKNNFIFKASNTHTIQVFKIIDNKIIYQTDITTSEEIIDLDVNTDSLAVLFSNKIDFFSTIDNQPLLNETIVFDDFSAEEFDLDNNQMAIIFNDDKVRYYEKFDNNWTFKQTIFESIDTNGLYGITLQNNYLAYNDPFGRSTNSVIMQKIDDTWIKTSFASYDDQNPSDLSGGGYTHAFHQDQLILGHVGYKLATGKVHVLTKENDLWESSSTIDVVGSSGKDFGRQVAQDENFLAVLAPGNNDYDNDDLYIYERLEDQWMIQQIIDVEGINTGWLKLFSIDLHQNRLVVGVPDEISSLSTQGVVYVYDFDGVTWHLTTKIPSPMTESPHLYQFGTHVSLSDDVLAVTGVGIEGSATIGFPEVPIPGRVFTYEKTNPEQDNWTFIQSIQSPDEYFDDRFGYSVSLTDDWMLVGAPSAYFGNANGNDAAYFYKRNNNINTWDFKQRITSDQLYSNGKFGFSVRINEDSAIIGNPSYGFNGQASIFQLQNNQWTKQKDITPDEREINGMQFGYSVDISKDFIAVGAPNSNYSSFRKGEAFVYKQFDQDWSLHKSLKSKENSFDYFGDSVAVSQENLIVAASNSNSNGYHSGAVFSKKLNEKFQIAVQVSGLKENNLITISYIDHSIYNITANGIHEIPERLTDGTAFHIKIIEQPNDQHCTVLNGQGIISSDINNIIINCLSSASITTNVSGLSGFQYLFLINSVTGDLLFVNKNGTYTFNNSLSKGDKYKIIAIDIFNSKNKCLVTDGNGTLDPIIDIQVSIECNIIN